MHPTRHFSNGHPSLRQTRRISPWVGQKLCGTIVSEDKSSVLPGLKLSDRNSLRAEIQSQDAVWCSHE
jgi:hypothetical protein